MTMHIKLACIHECHDCALAAATALAAHARRGQGMLQVIRLRVARAGWRGALLFPGQSGLPFTGESGDGRPAG